MPAPAATKTCFVTATTARFVPGTLVTLGSFRQYHPAFDGDIVVVHDGLPEVLQQHLARACAGVRFEPVSPELRDRLDALCVARPDIAPRRGRFHTLEAFRLRGYRKVLFYDSDVLFQGPVDALFDSPADLLCCGDVAYLRGLPRDAATFAFRPPAHPGAGAGAPTAARVLDRTFNTGFLLIDAALVEEGCYQGLLSLVSPQTLRALATPHTDQFILNRYFAGRQTLVGWTYNFLMWSAALIREREGIHAGNARALHFCGPAKPWMPDAMLRWTCGDPDAKPSSAFTRWYDAYVRCLTAAHMHGVGRRLGGRRE